MKKNKFLSLVASAALLGLAACNNSSDGTANADSTTRNGDSTGSTTTTTTTTTSSGNYAARADSVRTNVAAGNYLNPRTGKAYTRLNVDQSTGALTDETGRPVRRYVDKRNWWVYDTNNWDTVGAAQMKNNRLMYRGDNGSWEEYDKRWTDDMNNNTTGM